MTSTQPYANVSELGSILRKARTDAGLSQRKLSARADVTQEWIVNIEAGRVQGADTTRLIRTAEVLGLRFALVPGEGAQEPEKA